MSPQTTISLAWQLGVIPDEHRAAVIDTLVNDIVAHDFHLNVGIVGVKVRIIFGKSVFTLNAFELTLSADNSSYSRRYAKLGAEILR